jgi:hypothetical protein
MPVLKPPLPTTVVTKELSQELQRLIEMAVLQALEKAIGAYDDHNKLLNEVDTSQLLGVKPQTLSVWRTKSIGPAYHKIGSNVRYYRKDIEKYLTTNRIDR